MAKLLEEYIDRKSVRHRVEHTTLPLDDNGHRERMMEELIRILTKS